MTKESGDNGSVVTYREVVTTGSGDEGKCGPREMEVVTKGSGDEGSVVTKGAW